MQKEIKRDCFAAAQTYYFLNAFLLTFLNAYSAMLFKREHIDFNTS